MLWIKRMKDVSSEAELTHHQQYMVGKSVGRLYAQTSNCELKRQWVYFSTEVYELLVTTHTPTKRCNTLPTFLDAASRARTQWLTFQAKRGSCSWSAATDQALFSLKDFAGQAQSSV